MAHVGDRVAAHGHNPEVTLHTHARVRGHSVAAKERKRVAEQIPRAYAGPTDELLAEVEQLCRARIAREMASGRKQMSYGQHEIADPDLFP
jgi:hypothetical protein